MGPFLAICYHQAEERWGIIHPEALHKAYPLAGLIASCQENPRLHFQIFIFLKRMFIWVISSSCSFLWLLLELDGFLSSTKCLPANQVRIISFWNLEVFVSSVTPTKSGPQFLYVRSCLNVRWDDIHPSLIQGLGKCSCYIILLLIIKLLFILRAMDEKMENAFFLFTFYWSTVDLQCCVSFRCIAEGFSDTYTDVNSSSDSLPK